MSTDDLQAAVRRIMVLMMMADGRVHTAEIDMISEVHERLFGVPLSREDVDREKDAVQSGAPPLETALDEMAEAFEEEDREMILRAAACVSIADRALHRDEKILLIRIGTRLGLGPERVSSLLADVDR